MVELAMLADHGQIINIYYVPLSPGSIIRYQPTGGDALRLRR